jgi:hydroxylamine dehydrogenase
MKILLGGLTAMFLFTGIALAANAPFSQRTEECITCHLSVHPGIVAGWQKSLHAKSSPSQGLKKTQLERRISAENIPEKLAGVAVGCAECHTLDPEKHRDTFEHEGFKVHIVVTPQDCATCHPIEAEQFSQNLMSHAYGNLKNNFVYDSLADAVNGLQSFENMKTTMRAPDGETEAESCYHCHGTVVEVKGQTVRKTVMDEMVFPVLSGWPNQGVGRLNPDGSRGSCTACHTRHAFSIEMARKPHTCSQCHKGPDVPAYPVYQVSKHGNMYSSFGGEWNFSDVPWMIGRDFTAPTCASCHVSLMVTPEGEVVAERTHRMSNRLPWRIMGLIYAHPHPTSPDTTVIKNKAGLPLPTELTGEPVAEYLIGGEEQERRRKALQKVCLSCHGFEWVQGHWTRFEDTLKTTNEMTLTATKVMLTAWERGLARGLGQSDSIFNEALEKKWVEQWLFFANSTRFASAMAGADYGVFANGRWYMSKNIQEMADWLEFKLGGIREGKKQ